ncbi:MAG TPA: glycosyltransferase [Bacillota bacterium]|nr:glycosyltransferase [Bacillota bacterium]
METMKLDDRAKKLNLEKNFVSAVVYVRNNEKELELFFRGLTEKLYENFEAFEIIFINDYSSDKSVEIIKRVSKVLAGMTISIVNLSYYHGLETAMVAGVDLAIGDFVFEFDSPVVDYDFNEIMRVYYHSLKGYDIVSTSPETRGNFASRCFYSIFRRYSKNYVQLNTERFRILSRRAINRINILSSSIPYRKAVYYNCGLKTSTLFYVPIRKVMINFNDQQCSERLELAFNSLLIFTNLGARIALCMAVLMAFISLFMLGYTVYVYTVFDRVVEGWTTIMLFVSVSFTGVFILLAILIKYVSLILYLQHTKQNYVFESIEKLKQ